MEHWIVTSIIGVIGTVSGWVLGYYKARASQADKRAEETNSRAKELEAYVKKEDCLRCAEERSRIQARVDARINEGAKNFSDIGANIAVILEKISNIEKRIG